MVRLALPSRVKQRDSSKNALFQDSIVCYVKRPTTHVLELKKKGRAGTSVQKQHVAPLRYHTPVQRPINILLLVACSCSRFFFQSGQDTFSSYLSQVIRRIVTFRIQMTYHNSWSTATTSQRTSVSIWVPTELPHCNMPCGTLPLLS